MRMIFDEFIILTFDKFSHLIDIIIFIFFRNFISLNLRYTVKCTRWASFSYFFRRLRKFVCRRRVASISLIFFVFLSVLDLETIFVRSSISPSINGFFVKIIIILHELCLLHDKYFLIFSIVFFLFSLKLKSSKMILIINGALCFTSIHSIRF